MQTVTCSNEECGEDVGFDISDLDIEDSAESGNHTTQHSASGTVVCKKCDTETSFSCLYDELDDTGEILSFQVI